MTHHAYAKSIMVPAVRLAVALVFALGPVLFPETVSAEAATNVWVVVSFPAPGDDGYSGKATAYEVRYSDHLINQSSWGTAIPANSFVRPPQTANSRERIAIAIPNATLGSTYYVALKTRDEVFNWSLVSQNAVFVYELTVPLTANSITFIR